MTRSEHPRRDRDRTRERDRGRLSTQRDLRYRDVLADSPDLPEVPPLCHQPPLDSPPRPLTTRPCVVLATKVHGPMGDDPNQRGNSRRWIITEVENSLRRLQTDWIDLYQIHRPDPDTDIEETLSALTDLVRGGKVRAIGSSTMPASDIVEAQWVAERRGLDRFRTEQPPYTNLNRGIEAEEI